MSSVKLRLRRNFLKTCGFWSKKTCCQLFTVALVTAAIVILFHKQSKKASPPDVAVRPTVKQLDSQGRGVKDAFVKAKATISSHPFTHFTNSLIYEVGGERRAVKEQTDHQRAWFHQIRQAALTHLVDHPEITTSHFVYGWFRQVSVGTEWQVVFSNPLVEDALLSVRLYQPLSPPQLVETASVPHNQLLHMAVFTSGNSSVLANFLVYLRKFVVMSDPHLDLHFISPSEDVSKEKELLKEEMKGFPSVKWLIEHSPDKPLSSLTKNDPSRPESTWDLLLVVDDRILMREDFISRCRENAIRRKQMYIPTVFSLYDPHLSSSVKGRSIPMLHQLLNHNEDSGTWENDEKRVACIFRGDMSQALKEYQVGPPSKEDVSTFMYGQVRYLFDAVTAAKNIEILKMADPDLFLLHYSTNCSSNPKGIFQSSSSYSAQCLNRKSRLLGSKLVVGLALLRHYDGTDTSVVWRSESSYPLHVMSVLILITICCCLIVCLQSCWIIGTKQRRKIHSLKPQTKSRRRT